MKAIESKINEAILNKKSKNNLMTVYEFSKIVGCSAGAIYYQIDKGKIILTNNMIDITNETNILYAKNYSKIKVSSMRALFVDHIDNNKPIGQGHIVTGVPYQIRDKFYDLCKNEGVTASHAVASFIKACLDNNEILIKEPKQ